MAETKQPFERAMALAALCGSKIALGPAFYKTSKGAPDANHWVIAAIGEMLLDKIGVFPARFKPLLLIPHTVAGAWVARESLKDDGIDDPSSVAMAAVVAAGVAAVAPMIRITGRRILGIPDPILGLVEDYIALRLGSQALGVSMDQVKHAAHEAVEDAKGHVKPVLESVGIGG